MNTFSLADLTNNKSPKKQDLKPYCTSHVCCGEYSNKKIGVIKLNAKKTDIDCPDCKYALLWVTGNEKFFATKE